MTLVIENQDSGKQLKLGNVAITRGIKHFIDESPENLIAVMGCLERHLNCDWGDVCNEDKEMNDHAVELDSQRKESDRIISSYNLKENSIWIITEWDRSRTTILLPNEY